MNVQSSSSLTPLQPLAAAAAIGTVAGLLAYAFLRRPGSGGDYFFVWSAARSLLAGKNPYHVIAVGPENPGNNVFLYALRPCCSSPRSRGFRCPSRAEYSSACHRPFSAWALLKNGPHRLPIFMGAPFLMAISLGQWSPLITAAALESNLGFAFTAKPNLGLAAWLYRPNIRAIVGGTLILVLSLAILPSWPLDWYHNISGRPEKFSPIKNAGRAAATLGCVAHGGRRRSKAFPRYGVRTSGPFLLRSALYSG